MQQLLPAGWAWSGKRASFSFCMRRIHRRSSRARLAGRSRDLLRSWPCFPCSDNNSRSASLQEEHRVPGTTLKHPSPWFHSGHPVSALIIILYHTLCGQRPYGMTQEMQLLHYSSRIPEEETSSSPHPAVWFIALTCSQEPWFPVLHCQGLHPPSSPSS